MLLASLAVQSTDHVTMHDLLVGIPHDVSAFVVYAMLIASLYLIWRANRPQQPRS